MTKKPQTLETFPIVSSTVSPTSRQLPPTGRSSAPPRLATLLAPLNIIRLLRCPSTDVFSLSVLSYLRSKYAPYSNSILGISTLPRNPATSRGVSTVGSGPYVSGSTPHSRNDRTIARRLPLTAIRRRSGS